MTSRPGHPTPSIAEHGLIGDLRTTALIANDGAIDFLCWPRFDSPSVFARLLDPEGGAFELAPDLPGARRQQIYLPDTNVLITRWLSEDAVAEVTDLMPVADGGPQRLVRIVSCVRGAVRFRAACAPRFGYAREAHGARLLEGAALFEREAGTEAGPLTGPQGLRLTATVPLALCEAARDATADFALAKGETATFILDAEAADAPIPCGAEGYGAQCFEDTVTYWRRWIDRSTYDGRYQEIVRRSALALKLMVSQEHGSIVAAPTFGLPEALGGSRNWDYRYTWIRDAAFTLYAFVRLGLPDETHGFMRWVYERMEAGSGDGSLQIMYGLDGREALDERTLDHLAGYAGSRPVRVGNGAYDQLQLDCYGALMDAVYLANKYGDPISYDGWRACVRTVDWVCENWRREDEGIWEFRGGRRRFLSSRLMSWVAVDRALRMAQKCSLPAPVARWQEVRNAIHHSVFEAFWDEELGAFVQAEGERALDASCLLMPLVKFISPTDPRWLSTLDAVGEHLADDAMVRRYDGEASGTIDALEGMEGSFTICSFWYVECLARAGRRDEARLLFDKLLSYANPLGLYAEELGPAGDHLGNFPQAFTHLALISAAHALGRTRPEDPET